MIMHRNTAIFIAILAVIAGLVVIVNIQNTASQQIQPPSAPIPATTPAPVTINTHTSTDCGVSLEYPSNLKVVESTTSSTMFYDTSKPEDSVLLTCQQANPIIPEQSERIEDVAIHYASGSATISGTLYRTTTQENGTQVSNLIFTNPVNGLHILLAGLGRTFEQIMASIQLL